MRPAYLQLAHSGELSRRAGEAVARLAECEMCPRLCRVNRLEGEAGVCNTGRHAQVASWNLHFGEEDPLVGESGSGTIFFAQCNLGCVFCQNWDISHPGHAFPECPPERLAAIMLALAGQGALNINLVTPSHIVPSFLEALVIAAEQGLSLPIVYNTSAFDEVATLKLLDGVVDIYMPDAKFMAPDAAKRYCKAKSYPEKARAAIKEMHRQVGDLEIDERGIATRGLLVRHLVMPGQLAGTAEWMRFLAEEISTGTYVNIMGQYRPCGRASEYPEIDCAPASEEVEAARRIAREAGLTRLDERKGGIPLHLLRHLLR